MRDIMGDHDIAFPNLGIYLENIPKDFSVFGIRIALYGVIIACGMLLGTTLAAWVAKKEGDDPDKLWDAALIVIVVGVICARLYYVIFSWDYYKDDPIQIFNIRNGGLAIYGGVIGGFTALAVFAKINKMSYTRLADSLVHGLILGQLIGRWGNFTNREAFGQYTDNLLAMRLPVNAVRSHEITDSIAAHMSEATNYIQVHPTFLYESLWNICILAIMLIYRPHKRFDGEMTLLYFAGYGLGRFLIEGLRTDQLLIPGTMLPVSKVLAGCAFVLAVIADLVIRKKIRSS